MENSTAANSTLVELTVRDSLKDNVYAFTIKDNGKGMSPEFLAKVTDPWTTTRKTRKVGLGLPLIKMNTENAGGGMKIESTVGVGTTLNFWFQHDHLDRPPMGDLAGSLVMLFSAHEDIHFIYTHITDDGEFVFDTDEIKTLGYVVDVDFLCHGGGRLVKVKVKVKVTAHMSLQCLRSPIV